MHVLVETYNYILMTNCVSDPSVKSTTLKQKIQKHYDDVRVSKPKQNNEPEFFFYTVVRDAAIDQAIQKAPMLEEDMMTIFQSE